jgi:protein SCO1
MNSTVTAVRRVDRMIWAGLILAFPLVLFALALTALRLRVQSSNKPLPVLAQVADFTLTNQLGRPVSLGDLRGHPWVADIIFTRCPGPCLTMTRQMKELQQALPLSSTARLVTLTTDPDFDTPGVLQKYGERFNADPNRWVFLTGSKTQIGQVAVDSLKLTALPKKAEEQTSSNDLFVHSTIFVLVDQRGQLRGVYETTGEGTDPAQVKAQILADVRRLERQG